jgi:hypothetical protein
LERLGERQQEQARLDLIRLKFAGLLAPGPGDVKNAK